MAPSPASSMRDVLHQHTPSSRDELRTEEAFLRAFQARERYVPSARFTTWLYRIPLNLYRDEMRRLVRHPAFSISREYTIEEADREQESYELHEAIPDASAQELLERAEQERLLHAAMETLSPKHREVVVLRYEEGLDEAAIAERLGCSVGTVKSPLHYARQILRGCVQRRSTTPPGNR